MADSSIHLQPGRLVVLTNDSLFAYWLAKDTFLRHHQNIDAVVVSEKIKSSRRRIMGIIKKGSKHYAAYRILVEVLTRINRRLGRRSVIALAKRHEIPVISSTDVNRTGSLSGNVPMDLAIALNFDQVLKKDFIAQFALGVINVHASFLPKDKGISPVLWAFARGDRCVWSTIYKMDEGLDTGPIIDQFRIEVHSTDTSFSLYERVCRRSGARLAEAVNHILSEREISCTPQPESADNSYWSWPDSRYDRMMKSSRRSHLRIGDVFRSLKK
jgi:methionyl-tRNA formyltransferase